MEHLINLAAAYQGSDAVVTISGPDILLLSTVSDKDTETALATGSIAGKELCRLVAKLIEPVADQIQGDAIQGARVETPLDKAINAVVVNPDAEMRILPTTPHRRKA